MERESNPMQPMCRSGCGFYGNPATDGLCSVCFKDSIKKKQQPPVGSTSTVSSSQAQTTSINSVGTVVSSQSSFSTPTNTQSITVTTTNTAQPTVQIFSTESAKDKLVVEMRDKLLDSKENKVMSDLNSSFSNNKKQNLDQNFESKNNLEQSVESIGGVSVSSKTKSVSFSESNLALAKKSSASVSQKSVRFTDEVIESIKDLSEEVPPPLKKKLPNDECNLSTSPSAGPSTVDSQEQDDKESDKDPKKKKNRCAMCRKKVGLTGFECRCGGLFCAIHRYSDKHECTFDYREHGAAEIRRNNPVVVGEKIQKI